jgi:glycosyltransferase involved in cell wall biosynthesis
MRKKIIVKAPALSRSGYGEQARYAIRALRSREDLFDIYMVNIPWGNTGQVMDVTEETAYIKQKLMKTQMYAQQGGTFDLSLQITIPNEFEKIAATNIGYTAGIETTKVAPQWIDKCNAMVDKVLVVSNHSKKVFEQTKYEVSDPQGNKIPNWGLSVPVETINYAVREFEPNPIDIDFTTSKNFLTIAQWGPRKNLENTIGWFVQEFRDDEEVGLVVKTSTASDCIMDREHTTQRLQNLLSHVGEHKCKIYLVHGEVPTGALAWLYAHPTMKGFINLAHGEGYGLPLFEAACLGLPLITLAWSGQLDFICKPNKKGKDVPLIVKVDYNIEKVQPNVVWEGVIQEDSMWAYAKETSYKRALRECLTKEKHYKQQALNLQKHILKNFSEEKMYADFVNLLYPEEARLEVEAEIDDLLADLL